MIESGKIDAATGLQLVPARHSAVIHLAHDGAHFTLCGRYAIWRHRVIHRGKRCATCQWEFNRQTENANAQ